MQIFDSLSTIFWFWTQTQNPRPFSTLWPSIFACRHLSCFQAESEIIYQTIIKPFGPFISQCENLFWKLSKRKRLKREIFSPMQMCWDAWSVINLDSRKERRWKIIFPSIFTRTYQSFRKSVFIPKFWSHFRSLLHKNQKKRENTHKGQPPGHFFRDGL